MKLDNLKGWSQQHKIVHLDFQLLSLQPTTDRMTKLHLAASSCNFPHSCWRDWLVDQNVSGGLKQGRIQDLQKEGAVSQI